MRLDTIAGLLTVVGITFVVGLGLTLLLRWMLPDPLLELLLSNASGHALFLTIIFGLSFVVGLYAVGATTSRKELIARKFAFAYLMLYGGNMMLSPEIVTIYVACLFPVTAYVLALAFATENR